MTCATREPEAGLTRRRIDERQVRHAVGDDLDARRVDAVALGRAGRGGA